MNALELAGRLGLRKTRVDWRGVCPACSYSAFTVRGRPDQQARVSCHSCNDADAIAGALTGIVDGSWTPRQAFSNALAGSREKEQWARDIWDRAWPDGEPLRLYLARRGLDHLAGNPAVRFAPHLKHSPSGNSGPAMVCRVQDSDGRVVGVHRTFLTADGHKIEHEAKMTLGSIAGGAVRLAPHDLRLPLIVAEGIESGASASLLLGAPAWAAMNTGNLSSHMQLPVEVRRIIIAADPDEPGKRAAEAAALRWDAEERLVEIARLPGPDDWNDVLVREVVHG